MNKKQLSIYLIIILMVALLILVTLNINEENKIIRVVQAKDVKPGEIITVKIDVSVKSSETYYVLEEYVPAGWEVVDDGGGATKNPNKLAWITMENAKNTEYFYTVRAVENQENYNPSGIYMFDDLSNPQEF